MTGRYLWRGVTLKRNVYFLGKNFADLLKSQNFSLPNLKYQLKNK
jgi:hypothetical protein